MRTKGRRPQLLTVFGAVLVWLVAGIGVPLMIGQFSDDPSSGDVSVIASPAHSFQITEPVLLSLAPQVVVERGVLSLIDASGKPVSGQSAIAGLKKGRGQLMLSGGSIRIGSVKGNGTPGEAGLADSDGRMPDFTKEERVAHIDPMLAAFGTREIHGLQISDSSITAILPDRTELLMRGVRAKFDLSRKNQLSGSGTALVRGAQISFEARLGPETKPKQGAPATIAAQLKAKGELFAAEFDGQLDAEPGLEMRGTTKLQGGHLRRAIAWLMGGSSDGAGLKKFELAGELDWSQQAMAFDKASVKLDENEATGALAINLSGTKPSITGTLALNRLTLTRYVMGDLEDQKKSAFDWASLYALPFQMPLGQQIDADVRLSASRVAVGELEFGPAAATVAIKSGRMLADIAQLQLAGGEGAGQIGVEFRTFGPAFTMRGRLVNVDLSRLAPANPLLQLVQGETGVSADLTARGGSLTEVVRSMSGTFGIRSEKAGRMGIDVQGLLEAARNEPVDGWTRARAGMTQYDTLAAELSARDGVVVTKRLEAVSGKTLWSADGQFNIASGEVDLKVAHGPVPAPDGKSGGQSGTGPAGSDPLRLEIRGPIGAPSIRAVPAHPQP